MESFCFASIFGFVRILLLTFQASGVVHGSLIQEQLRKKLRLWSIPLGHFSLRFSLMFCETICRGFTQYGPSSFLSLFTMASKNLDVKGRNSMLMPLIIYFVCLLHFWSPETAVLEIILFSLLLGQLMQLGLESLISTDQFLGQQYSLHGVSPWFLWYSSQ